MNLLINPLINLLLSLLRCAIICVEEMKGGCFYAVCSQCYT